MAQSTVKKRSRKVGLPPGTLVHVGARKMSAPKITIFDYDESQFHEQECKAVDECLVFSEKPTVSWINVDGIHQVDIVDKIGGRFSVHPLTLEDVLNTTQRPKIEDFTKYLFLVLKMPYYNESRKRIEAEQISIILTPTCVISFQEREGDVFNPIRERIRNDKGQIRARGADYLAYALVDAIVDGCFSILETIGERVEGLEDKLVTHPNPETFRSIHGLKREMILLRKAMWPLREVVNGLTRGDSSLVQEGTCVYLRDVYDHTVQVIDTIESFRDMVSGMLEIYLSSVSNRMNEVMKVLTIIATVFIPLTFIAGIYGMNFKYMPELEWRGAYPIVLGVMVAVAGVMFCYFRRKRWL